MTVRRTFEKMPGVLAAYPFGDSKTVQVICAKKDGLSEEMINSAIAKRKDIKLVSLKQTSVASDN